MIRKVIHIVLILTVLTTSTGMTIYSHYCGTTLKSVSLNVEPTPCCTDCNSCHNETVSVKSHDNFSVPAFIFDFHPFELTLPAIQQLFIEEPTTLFQFLVLVNDLPPPPIQTILSSLQTYRL
jgi:hypothetical protein